MVVHGKYWTGLTTVETPKLRKAIEILPGQNWSKFNVRSLLYAKKETIGRLI